MLSGLINVSCCRCRQNSVTPTRLWKLNLGSTRWCMWYVGLYVLFRHNARVWWSVGIAIPIPFSQSRDQDWESLIPGSRRDYRDSGIKRFLSPYLGITKTGTQAVDWAYVQVRLCRPINVTYTSRITVSTAYSVVIVVGLIQSTESRNKNLSCRRQTARCICANTMTWLTSWKHAPPCCYHAEFGRSALKGVGINTG